MKILITGSKGQLGSELISIIKKGEAEIGKVSAEICKSVIVAADVEELDITNIDQVNGFMRQEAPDIIINCAAATNVDGCETNEETAYKINSLGPRNLAIAAETSGAKLVQISTDYVFDGKSNNPLREFDLTHPVSVYGKSKLLGEQYVREFSSRYFIVRTAWLYGYSGKNFVYTMLNFGKSNEVVRVVNDQRGNPTNANDLAYHILKIIETECYGVYHCTGEGECTWFEFAEAIMKEAELNCKVVPCTSKEYITAAERPAYSSLDNMMLKCTVGNEMRPWQQALKSFINQLKV